MRAPYLYINVKHISSSEEPSRVHYAIYSIWSRILATLLSATGGNFSAIHVDYMDFVPELGWQFRSRNL